MDAEYAAAHVTIRARIANRNLSAGLMRATSGPRRHAAESSDREAIISATGAEPAVSGGLGRRGLLKRAAVLGVGGFSAEAVPSHGHRIVFQVNADDPVPMKHAVSNSINLLRHYREMGEPAAVEIVAYGAGIAMFRADTSPVHDILESMHATFPEIAFTVCGNTKAIIEKREGRAMPLIDGTRVVPFGIVRIVELQEAGWSYIRP